MSEVLANVSCVAIGGRALLILGAPGSGKSSLALALIDRGAVLVGDDGVTLERTAQSVIASPPPRIAGLIELRNIGLVTMPTTSARIALAVRLNKTAPRLPQTPSTLIAGGMPVPLIELWPDCHVLAIRAERALDMFGYA